ncbi:MAG TPA: TRAP transporter large permease [Geminicoccus sp.]|jgi:C4-dicarboxylate transporter DctM subunit|uniref:TRAP transporter large permease n=1 Tax=Geminicoccus sp. TaxID=2024832 RepID=UPI002E381449|nr:TRAP transporter large permease [Geminicoccus sp.]HEX2529061.1 TRAP transporter large permease [Geminicoccus sp.]
MTAVLLVGFVVLLLVNAPVSFALAIASFMAITYGGIPPALVAQRMTAAIDSFILLAVPFFLLAGHLMARSGIARDIIEFANATVGWARGGLAQANIGAGTLMGGMTGSAVAEASSAGGIMIPPMKAKGYDGAFCAAVTAAASTISVVIPPSIPMIIFCVITGVSVSQLFVAGIIPGLLIALTLMVTAWAISTLRGYAKGPRTSLLHILKTARASIWGLMMPLVIIGSIRYGIATPTEASVVAVVYSLLVGMFVYRTIELRDLPRIVLESCVTTGVVMLMIASASLYGLIITREQIPQEAAEVILGLTTNPTLVLLLILCVYLFAGMLLDLGASIIILVPVLWPVTQSLQIDPIQFGIVTVVGLAIGLVTPPVGASLFVTCGIARCNLVQGSIAAMPFVLALIAIVVAIIFVPGLATWLPSRMD